MRVLLEKISNSWQWRVVAVIGIAILLVFAVMIPDADYEQNARTEMSLLDTSAKSSPDRDAAASHLSRPWFEENRAVAEKLVRVAQDYQEGAFPRDVSGPIQGLLHEAKQGNAAAQFLMGDAYQKGFGLPKDDMQAALWYSKAGETRRSEAGTAIVPVNGVSQALASYRELAESGNSNAQLYVALAYDLGQELPQSSAEAAHWYRTAAGRGSASAATNLGVLYHNGDGVPKDDVEALAWFERAASHGSALAEYCLGRMYLQGDGVPRNEATAAGWFDKAAQQGNAPAQIVLSSLYATGRGVSVNTAMAYMWINLASAKEPEIQKTREQLESTLRSQEFEEGQRLSHNWMARHMRMLQ